jgi:hypothetical protein
MRLSSRLRGHRWKSGSLSPGDHGWDFSDDPIKAADFLDKMESLLHDLQRSYSESNAINDGFKARIRVLLAELEGKSVSSAVTAYYVLEDKKRRALPLNVDEAIEILREEFIAGHTHGALCIEDALGDEDGDELVARGERDWATFELKARTWLAKAINLALLRQG